jgi:hypothetical protein
VNRRGYDPVFVGRPQAGDPARKPLRNMNPVCMNAPGKVKIFRDNQEDTPAAADL